MKIERLEDKDAYEQAGRTRAAVRTFMGYPKKYEKWS